MRRLVIVIGVLALAWFVGFAAFVGNLPKPAAAAPEKSEGIVVYTGGPDRIVAGMEILAQGHGGRLLISGVHRDVSRKTLSSLWKGTPDQFDCCVDLGRLAQTTEGNADEVGAWAKDNNYKTITLVTSDYHMPRALATTRSRMPKATIRPFAVSSGYLNDQGRPASFKATVKLAGEYTKFILAHIKALVDQIGN